ncbi:hypothetical protein QJS10_CPA03g00594 [Acorus calamus]|uniref:HEAT repeat-containing protein n=1 Tax=Acorus calamus TaxID=4465 RepID=A0AAV9F5E6_ACOCL|nr:hypothetical protein QJS10_CPA03g00594 [Acorus calamus]
METDEDLFRSAEVERSSLCNCVVNFLLQENYLLTAFELLHELLDDGRDAQAIRLKEFFSDPSQFPPDQISRFNDLRVADPQSLLEAKESLEEKLAISEYELRLGQEDLSRLKTELEKKSADPSEEFSGPQVDAPMSGNLAHQQRNGENSFSDLGSLKDAERRDLNCAVKEYLLIGGYRLTAMTFYEEVTDQNLDVWQNSPACVPDALRRYYYQFLSSTAEAAEEKFSLVREKESLLKENEMLNDEINSLRKNKDFTDAQMIALNKSLETVQKDLKDREILVHDLKQSLELQRKELNNYRSEITSLKMHIEGFTANRGWDSSETEHGQFSSVDNYKAEITFLQKEIEQLKGTNRMLGKSIDPININEDSQTEDDVVEIHEDKALSSHSVNLISGVPNTENVENQTSTNQPTMPDEISRELMTSSCNGNADIGNHTSTKNHDSPLGEGHVHRSDSCGREKISDGMGLETIQILSDALPKIVPYVLINHREELLPLIMCAIERHPDSNVRDSLTHTLFNLIKRPDEDQRRVIMDACVSLSKSVGEMRTETELLPQCWEQINHMYEERRVLVAQSCGELAEFVRPEIRDSLILSIVQQLIEDSAIVVRQAAAHNLALLLPLFPNMDKYFKVEELMFQLICDPSGVVVETSLKEIVPAVISWGNKLDHILRVLLSHILGSVQRCPPLSGVEGSVDSHLHVLGERERWNVDVLLRMMTELLPFLHQKAVETCPFPSAIESHGNPESTSSLFSSSLFELYAGGRVDWPIFDWLHIDCFPDLIQLACLLPQKEDNLRNRMTKFLLSVTEKFGDEYLTGIMLPIFLVSVGDNADLALLPPSIHSRIKGLRPKTALGERLAIMCVLPLLLAGLLGTHSKKEQLAEYLRRLLVENTAKQDSWSVCHTAELINAVRFLCTFEEHHGIIFNVLWEMVVSSNVNMKINAANILKVLVPYIDVKVASTHVLPALVTLGSDQNLNVKYASIEAFGAVAQHFKSDVIVDKIRVQMDAFLEDGSHEATIAVIRALLVAVPHTTERLRDYLLTKIFQLTSMPTLGSDVTRRRERANAFCESVRALDATDLPASSVRDFLLPSIQNLLKDLEALDPAHKEALEIIMKERSGGTFEAISKVMGAHLGIASSVTSLFGEGGLLGKRENEATDPSPSPQSAPSPQPPSDDTRFRRIMRGGFGDMLRGKGKGVE